MKSEAQAKQHVITNQRQDEAELGDISRHWRAARLIAARQPSVSRTARPASNKRN